MHHDKTRDLARGAPILSLSVGAERDFRVGTETFAVRDGDLVVLPWEVNRRVKHGVPVRRRARGVRYFLRACRGFWRVSGATSRKVSARSRSGGPGPRRRSRPKIFLARVPRARGFREVSAR
jgi:hypothetical protein